MDMIKHLMCFNGLWRGVFCVLAIAMLWRPEFCAAESEYYTVLAASYSSLENAELDYNRLVGRLDSVVAKEVRIELVGGYYTIRVGRYTTEAAAANVLATTRRYFGEARVLSAYIRPERIVKGVVPVDLEPGDRAANEQVPPLAADGGDSHVERLPSAHFDDALTVVHALPDDLVSQVKGEKFFCVQLGSFTKKELADEEYDRVVALYHDSPIPWLRVEKIQQFYTIRAGRFASEKEADTFSVYMGEKYPIPTVLRAYIGADRIDRIVWFRGESPWETIAGETDDAGGALGDHSTDERGAIGAAGMNSFEADLAAELIAGHKDSTNTRLETSAEVPVKMLFASKKKQKITKSQVDLFHETAAAAAPGEEFFTVQLASYSDMALATIEYETYQARVPPEQCESLRIEFIKGYFAVRVGKFGSRAQAEASIKAIDSRYPQASIIYAYVVPERIQRIWRAEEQAPQLAQQVNVATSTPEVSEYPGKGNNDVDVVNTEVTLSSPVVEQISDDVGGEKDNVKAAQKSEFNSEPVVELTEDVSLKSEASGSGSFELKAAEKPEFTYEVLTVLTKDDKGENIRMPSSLFYDYGSDELYLINGVNNRLIIYGPDFFPQNSIGKGRGLDSPLSGVFTPDGKVYVTQAGTPSSEPRITLLNSAFFPEKEIEMRDIPESNDFIPQKVALTKNGSLYVSGLNSKRVLVLDGQGAFKKWFEVAIDKRGEYVFSDASKPEMTAAIKDIEVDSEGDLIVLSEETSKIYVFDAHETFLFSFGKKGGAEGKLSRPRAVTLDEKRRCFFVVDYMRHTVLIYDINGEFKYEFGGRGWGPEWFNYPVDIILGRNGNLIVADFFNQRAQVFELSLPDHLPEKSAELWRLQ